MSWKEGERMIELNRESYEEESKERERGGRGATVRERHTQTGIQTDRETDVA